MKKGMGPWLIVGGAVVVIGVLGFILLRKPKEQQTSGNTGSTTPETLPTTSGTDVVTTPAPSGPSFEVMGFVQKSNTPNVNILKGPTLFSGVAKKVESFTTIYARPSKSGWFEVSEDGTTTLGYVPNGTLRKL